MTLRIDDAAFSLAEIVEARPIPEPARPIFLPSDDDVSQQGGDPVGHAEGQSFMIEYADSKGRASRRRITVWSLKQNSDGILILIAKCHERNASRTFRADRITACIDHDGEVHDDVPAFLSETFGTARNAAAQRPAAEVERANKIRAIIRADAVLLSSMSRADSFLRQVETDTAVDHLSYMVERAGIFLTPDEIEALGKHFRRLRPNVDSIREAIAMLAERGPDHIKRTLIAAAKVMDSDGERHQAEAVLLNSLAHALLGMRLF